MALESGSRTSGMNRKAELLGRERFSFVVPLLTSQAVGWGTREHESASHKTAMVNSGRSLPPFLSFSPHSVVSDGNRIIGILCVWWIHGVLTLGSMFLSFLYVYSGNTTINGRYSSSKNTLWCLVWFSCVCVSSLLASSFCYICRLETNWCKLAVQDKLSYIFRTVSLF